MRQVLSGNARFALRVLGVVLLSFTIQAAAAGEFHNGLGTGGSAGRSIADPSGNAKLFSIVSACAAGLPAGAALGSASKKPVVALDGSLGASLASSKCVACHQAKGLPSPLTSVGATRVLNGSMPPPADPSSPQVSQEERTAIANFLNGQGTL